ncbi:MAG: hypothetical protein LUF92_18000 [Clostridiales bacterium]|nr:hypothetical protein [Clostridiales bacterium]
MNIGKIFENGKETEKKESNALMEEKNRFSKLLGELMVEAEIKNQTLAKEVQYDVSYIGKWVSGNMLPAEKTKNKVIGKISHCLAFAASPEGLADIMADYNVEEPELLEMALYDHLIAEYEFVKEQEKNEIYDIGKRTFYYPELTMPQFLVKMHHPVLRQVKSLKILSLVDLMALDHDSRLRFVSMERGLLNDEQRPYPNVHFSLILNIDMSRWDYVYDTLFLINMVANSMHINFNLYSSERAYGRVIFAVENNFMISGLVSENGRCFSVVTSEDSANCNIMYEEVRGFINNESLMFQNTTMIEMMEKLDYAHGMLSPNLRSVIGHLTEHFLPDELFDELLEQAISIDPQLKYYKEDLIHLHMLNKSVLESSNFRIIIYETAFSELAVTDTFDFYNCKVTLTPRQKKILLNYIISLLGKEKNLHVKMIFGRLISDYKCKCQ